MQRLLFLIHRWAGVALGLFMALWFITGLVIIYSVPMNQTRHQQLAHGETLAPEAGWLSLGEAWERSAAARAAGKEGDKAAKVSGKGGESSIAEARLVRQGGEPRWLVEEGNGRRLALSARDGSLHETTPEEAVAIANQWFNGQTVDGAVSVRFVETEEKPFILRNQDHLRPFHRVAADDGGGSELLISVRTGEVAHASTRLERGLYIAGNWLHLFRFLDSLGLGEARTDVLLWAVSLALAATLTGLVVGWIRWRPGWFGRASYSGGRVHPYRALWFRWHFWVGLIGGLFALLWTLSGVFNTNPGQIFSPAAPSKEEWARYTGKGIPAALRDWKPAPLAAGSDAVIELGWRRLGDEAVLLAHDRNGGRQALSAAGSISDEAAIAAARRLVGRDYSARATLLDDYDSYYYPRHGRGLADRPLPVLQVDLADVSHTRLYVDPQDGRLLLRQDDSRRVYRWLFNALHYWDFGFLYARPLWDAWMLTWVLLGIVLGVSSVVLGYKRLVFTLKPKRRRQAAAGPEAVPPLVTENRAG